MNRIKEAVAWTLFILLSLVGCGKERHESKRFTLPSPALSDVVSLYKGLAIGQRDDFGFILTDPADGRCDSLIFSALQGSVLGPINIEAAQASPGEWRRLPLADGSCFDEDETGGSDISRDMMVGLLVYAQRWGRQDITRDLIQYAQDHSLRMGRDRKTLDTRTFLTPTLLSLIAQVDTQLGGPEHPVLTAVPQEYSETAGFESHLSLIKVLIVGRIYGSLGDKELDLLRVVTARSPGNALAQALLHRFTDGDQTVAAGLLLSVWPSTQLPTSADWCEPWRTQRADGDTGLTPCNFPGIVPRIHPGGDLLFVADVINEH